MTASLCPRCNRGHSGACGIPRCTATGGLRMPACPPTRVGVHSGLCRAGATSASSPQFSIQGRPIPAKPRPRSTKTLEHLLTWGEEEYGKVLELLKSLPKEMPAYADLLDREGKLARVIQQVRARLSDASS